MILNKTPIGPADALLDIIEIKSHLRIDDDSDDAYLISLIDVATKYIENKTNRILRNHEIEYYVGSVNKNSTIFLPYGCYKVKQVINNNKTLVTPTDIRNGIDRTVFFQGFDDVRIIFECGYTNLTLPSDLKHAMLLLIGTMYESRMDITYGVQTYKTHFTSENLISPYKIYPNV